MKNRRLDENLKRQVASEGSGLSGGALCVCMCIRFPYVLFPYVIDM